MSLLKYDLFSDIVCWNNVSGQPSLLPFCKVVLGIGSNHTQYRVRVMWYPSVKEISKIPSSAALWIRWIQRRAKSITVYYSRKEATINGLTKGIRVQFSGQEFLRTKLKGLRGFEWLWCEGDNASAKYAIQDWLHVKKCWSKGMDIEPTYPTVSGAKLVTFI